MVVDGLMSRAPRPDRGWWRRANSGTSLASLAANDVSGLNTGRIAPTEAEHGEMWAEGRRGDVRLCGSPATASQSTLFSELGRDHDAAGLGGSCCCGPGTAPR